MPTTSFNFLIQRILIVFWCGQRLMCAQPDLPGCEWTQFNHANGSVASEGCLVQGIPTGMWKNFSDQGLLLSEGAREHNAPVGVWTFYELGVVKERTAFDQGLKDGVQTLWVDGMITDSIQWIQGLKQGIAKSFRDDGSIQWVMPYLDDRKEGKAVEYNPEGLPIQFRWYKGDRLVASESFNRLDDNGLKSGPWKVFHPSGRVVETGFFVEGLAHGTFKYFGARGNLVEVRHYEHGEWILDATEVQPDVEIREVRREDGTLASTQTYVDGVLQGVSRQFDEEGVVVGGGWFEDGVLKGEGITTLEGERHGPWIEYWPQGSIRVTGAYDQGVPVGEWVYYRPEGQVEQRGLYWEGLLDQTWKWWYEDGSLHREEQYRRGELHGVFLELDSIGNILVQGEYMDGLEEGLWLRHVHDYQEEGWYTAGVKHGVWQASSQDGQLLFEGNFDLGQPEGKHKTWYANGMVKEVGNFEGGFKHGKWVLKDEAGLTVHEYIYRYGKIRKVNGMRVDKRRDKKLKE